jgi:hypothetical protein
MYIEFSLPHGSAGQAAIHANHIINRALHAWSDQYNIPYNVKNVKYFKRITFDDDAHYSLFAMTWNSDQRSHALSRWRIVSDLNNKSSFEDHV